MCVCWNVHPATLSLPAQRPTVWTVPPILHSSIALNTLAVLPHPPCPHRRCLCGGWMGGRAGFRALCWGEGDLGYALLCFSAQMFRETGREVFSTWGHPSPPPEKGSLLRDHRQRLQGPRCSRPVCRKAQAHQTRLCARSPVPFFPPFPDKTPQHRSCHASAGFGVTVSSFGQGS